MSYMPPNFVRSVRIILISSHVEFPAVIILSVCSWLKSALVRWHCRHKVFAQTRPWVGRESDDYMVSSLHFYRSVAARALSLPCGFDVTLSCNFRFNVQCSKSSVGSAGGRGVRDSVRAKLPLFWHRQPQAETDYKSGREGGRERRELAGLFLPDTFLPPSLSPRPTDRPTCPLHNS